MNFKIHNIVVLYLAIVLASAELFSCAFRILAPSNCGLDSNELINVFSGSRPRFVFQWEKVDNRLVVLSNETCRSGNFLLCCNSVKFLVILLLK